MAIRITITKPQVTDQYGIAMVQGQTYTVDRTFGQSLVQQGRASDTDNALSSPTPIAVSDIVWLSPAEIASPSAQQLRHPNIIYKANVPPYQEYKSNGTALISMLSASQDLSGNLKANINNKNVNLNLLSDTKYPAQISRAGFTPSQVIATGQDGTGAGGWSALIGTVSSETVDVPNSNTRSVVKFTYTGSGTGQDMQCMHKIPAIAINGKFEILVKLPKVSTGSYFFYWGWSATAPANDPPTARPAGIRQITVNSVERADGVWTKLSFNPPANRFSTGGNLAGRAWISTEALPSTVNYIELYLQPTGVIPSELVLLVDHAAINGITKPIVTIGFDGFYPSQASIALPLFEKYGFKGYSSSSGNNIAANKSTTDALYNSGWDLIQQGQRIGNYGTDANAGSLSADIDSAYNQFSAAGYTRAYNIFTYPFNSRQPASDAILASKRFNLALSTNGITALSQLKTGSLLSLGRLSMNNNTAVNMQAALDAAILEGSHVSFYGHDLVASVVDPTTQTLTTEFTTFMAYVATKYYAGLIDVVTPSEFLGRIQQL